MALRDVVDAARQKVLGTVGAAMAGLAQEATRLSMADAATRLGQTKARLESDTFRLIVVGRFKNGKSTTLNALLGKLTHPVPELRGRGPMPTDDLPCTATLTRIQYAQRPYVKLWRFDGSSETWGLDRYLKESTVRGDEAQNQTFFADVREFEVGFPAELCQAGVTVLDSPGTDDVPHRTAVTTQAIRDCDAAVVVYRHDVFAGQTEREFVAQHLTATGTRVFTVVNLWGGRPVDDRLRGLVWNRLVKDQRPGAPAYAGQDPAAQDIFFVDVGAAERAKLAGDAETARKCGMTAFEDRLGAFLTGERQSARLAKWLAAADAVAVGMEQQIAQRSAGLRQDQARIQQAADQIAPKLQAIQARRDSLPGLFDRACHESQRALRLSFLTLVEELRRELPDRLAAEPLPSLQSVGGRAAGVFNSKRAAEEAMAVCHAVISERFDGWANAPTGGGQQAVAPVLDRLWDDIRREVDTIERDFQAIQLDLTGWRPAAADAPKAGMADRVLSGLVGAVLLNPVAAAGGGAAGWRGALGAVGGTLVAKVLLGMLGFAWTGPLLPVVILGAVVGSVLLGGQGLERRVKDAVLRALVDGVDGKGQPLKDKDGRRVGGLVAAPIELGPAIDAQVREAFDGFEQSVTAAVADEVRAEEENIRRVIDEGKRDQAEKARLLALLEDVARKVAGHRQTLAAAARPA